MGGFMEDRLRALEQRLAKVEEAVNLLAAIVEPLAKAHAEGRVEGKSAKDRGWLKRVCLDGKWFSFRGLGFPHKPRP